MTVYEVLRPDELGGELWDRWVELQSAHRELWSPYFSPLFVRSVASVRGDVRVAVIRRDSVVEGFFPFQRRRFGFAQPVGGGLSDYHGIVSDPALHVDLGELFRAAGIVSWAFDHLPANQAVFKRYQRSVELSPIIDVSRGFDVFERERMRAGGKQLKETYRRIRKLHKEVGAHRFVQHAADPAVLEQMVRWKSEQCRGSGVVDYFRIRWARELVRRLHAMQSRHLSGQLSALYVGEELLAVHFCMKTPLVWHSWFPGYDRRFRVYSPGLILLVEMTRAAAEQGVRHIDLGKDVDVYKEKMMTGGIPIASGCVERSALAVSTRRIVRRVGEWTRRTPLSPIGRLAGRLARRYERRWRFA